MHANEYANIYVTRQDIYKMQESAFAKSANAVCFPALIVLYSLKNINLCF